MFNRRLLALALSSFWFTSAFAQGTAVDCGSSNPNLVVNPPTFVWQQDSGYHTGTLVMDQLDLTLNNGETLTTRAYAQEGQEPSIPGPTLVMQRGQQYVMSFKNLLPYEPLTHEHNTFTDPNVTNVHTHGLHISGESPGDDVTRAFEGQRGGDYVYDIPLNHMGGTFWYHAHHHGSTFLQVSTGAFGLIIIDDADDGIPANVAAMEEKHLLLGYLEPGNAAGTGGDSLISGSFSAGWTINGKVNGDVCVPPNTWQHWRMLVADQDSRLVDLEIGANCEVALMGRDGVWRTEVPKSLPDGTLTLTGASRADLAVRCSDKSSISVAGVQVANILVDPNASADTGPHPYDADGQPWLSARPAYLRDLRDGASTAGTVQDSETIRMGARTILGRKFDASIPNLEKTANGVQEWTINGAAQHPFHLHIYHVQVQSDCGPYESGEYYDVIAGNCDVRFDMSPTEAYEGMTILHCHILQHEDQGAMGWMDVTGGRPPPEFPGEGLFDYYYTLSEDPPTGEPAAPTNLTATAISSSQINLAWEHDSSGVDYFVIERFDGGVFAEIDTTSASLTSYQNNTGLSESTTYDYRVGAVNNFGTSYSNTASATTLTEGGDPTSVDVGSITLSTVGAGRGEKAGQATITVVDDLGNPVTNALVSGYFSGDFTGSVNQADTLDSDSVAVRSQSTVPNKTKNLAFSFCVTSIEHDTLTNLTSEVCEPQ